jgi:hypothetical protein
MEKVIDIKDFDNIQDFMEELNSLKKWCDNNQCVIRNEGTKYYAEKIIFPTLTEEEQRNILRNKRKPLLDAFDKWEKAVLRGREIDSIDIMTWFHLIKALDENALNNVPERVKYYL